ncbi:hypothetical protein EZS27_028690 [termite gut metagenome]|uniref:Pectate lyase n=2 Tax=termite gut metagenome TaxID=433724 RepID=A0A5J4QL44_9ZZZZ
MKHTINLQRIVIFLLITICVSTAGLGQSKPTKEKVLSTMKEATRYMMDKVSYKSGFVWNYLPDFSRQWGELEAYRTMVWVQAPSTPEVGHLLLDAYHATGDEYYYESAKKVADALIWGQLPCGGWNYMFDFSGEGSLKQWYATIGRQAWRLEEFQHYYGNATFDDSGTIQAGKFLLRLYVEKNDPIYKPALEKVIRFVLESQYPNGGWPQRYPLMYDHVFQGKRDYSSFITLNDDVSMTNIEFLVQCYQAMGLQNIKEPITRAMNLMIALQQGVPYAGWSDQYTPEDLKPAHARSYEPRAIGTGVTIETIYLMFTYYKLTGETKFIAGIPAALDFLESMQLPDSEKAKYGKKSRNPDDVLLPRFINPDTGIPLYIHRKGSNVDNGYYYIDQDISNTLAHYGSGVYTNLKELRKEYEAIKNISAKELTRNSPLLENKGISLGKYYTRMMQNQPIDDDNIIKIIKGFTKEGCWLTPLSMISNPYKPLEHVKAIKSDDTRYTSTYVGDEYDTSCYKSDTPIMGISTGVYIANMAKMIQYIDK